MVFKKELSYIAVLVFIAFAMSFAGTADAQNATDKYDLRLTWAAPTQRENGKDLSIDEIAGYEIKYGLDGVLDNTIKINNGSTLSHDIVDLAAGIYSFAIATVDTNGVYSDFSAQITYVEKDDSKPALIDIKAVVQTPVGFTCESNIKTSCVEF